jgi:hypothetical protein
MFQVATGDNWSLLARSLMQEDDTLEPTVVLFFISFIGVVNFTLLPVVRRCIPYICSESEQMYTNVGI